MRRFPMTAGGLQDDLVATSPPELKRQERHVAEEAPLLSRGQAKQTIASRRLTTAGVRLHMDRDVRHRRTCLRIYDATRDGRVGDDLVRVRYGHAARERNKENRARGHAAVLSAHVAKGGTHVGPPHSTLFRAGHSTERLHTRCSLIPIPVRAQNAPSFKGFGPYSIALQNQKLLAQTAETHGHVNFWMRLLPWSAT